MNKNSEQFTEISSIERPEHGWIRFARKMQGLTGSQLGERLGVSRASISQKEKAELDGGITLRAMQELAEAMDCEFVYEIRPKVD